MRLLLFYLLLSLTASISAQADTLPPVDTTIYKVADEMPRFPSRACEEMDTTLIARNQCAQQALLRYISARSLYPQEAREQGLEGTPVVSFIVEKNGLINNPRVVRDPGGNLGLAALQAVFAMQREVRWRPAIVDGQPVRFEFALPVRFKLTDPLPYQLYGRDTVYTELDEALGYEGGVEALQTFFREELEYPEKFVDSCWTGQIDVRVLIQPDNQVRILDITDYNDLGFDFWYESIHAATSSYGRWIPAKYEGRAVPAAFDLSMNFLPEAPACKSEVERYKSAFGLASEGNTLITEGQVDEGIAKLSEALAMYPNDGQLLIARGQAFLDANRLSEACVDLTLASRITLVDWFDAILPLICRPE